MPDDQDILRIILALRARIEGTFKAPPVSEIEFIEITGNHGQFRRKLKALGQTGASDDIEKYIHHVGLCWLRLAFEHLEDARRSLAANGIRASFSRSYYAAYNASKAVRYIVGGAVSLKGEDHSKASSDLPDDFPSVERWSQIVTELYEHRLRADYDNWVSTSAEHSLTPEAAFRLSEDFVERCRVYLSARLGVQL